MKTDRFQLIEIGRAFAAIVVVLHHAGNIMAQPRFFGAEPFGAHFRNFNVGVDFFFVLSGFIITWMHVGEAGRPEKVVPYLRKRFLRIFPPYWVILLLLIVLYQLVPSAGHDTQRDPVNILLSIVLLPNPVQPVLGVAWTLTHEVFFYVAFALLIVFGRKLAWLAVLWAVGIALWNVILDVRGSDPSYVAHFPWSFLFSAFNIEFLLGVAAALFLRRRRVPFPGWLMSASLAAFILLMVFAVNIQDHALVGRLAFGVPATLFLLGAVEFERERAFVMPPGLMLLGRASYAIYLIHPLALSLLVQAFVRLAGRQQNLELVSLAMAILAVLIGVLYHLAVEKPAIRLASRVWPTGTRSVRRAA